MSGFFRNLLENNQDDSASDSSDSNQEETSPIPQQELEQQRRRRREFLASERGLTLEEYDTLVATTTTQLTPQPGSSNIQPETTNFIIPLSDDDEETNE